MSENHTLQPIDMRPNKYQIQAVFRDNLEYFTTNVFAYDPIEAEAIARAKTERELLIAGVILEPAN